MCALRSVAAVKVCVYSCVFCGFLPGMWLFHFSTCAHEHKKKREVLHYKREWDTNRPSHSFILILIPSSPVLSQPLPSLQSCTQSCTQAHSSDGMKPPPFLSLKLCGPNCSTDHKCHITTPPPTPSSSFFSYVYDYLHRIDEIFWGFAQLMTWCGLYLWRDYLD